MSLKYPDKKIVVIIIAYNAEQTIQNAIDDIPKDFIDLIIVGDDDSLDNTYNIIRNINGIVPHKNKKNLGMGGNLKVLMNMAITEKSDIIIQLHGDNQYDASKIPFLLHEMINKEMDMVLGSRILGGQYLEGGGPLWKFFGNHFLNFIQNLAYGLKLSDYATGYKIYTTEALKKIPYNANREDFIFDEQINNQFVFFNYKISQVGIPTRYNDDSSSVGFLTSMHYGIMTLITVIELIIAI